MTSNGLDAREGQPPSMLSSTRAGRTRRSPRIIGEALSFTSPLKPVRRADLADKDALLRQDSCAIECRSSLGWPCSASVLAAASAPLGGRIGCALAAASACAFSRSSRFFLGCALDRVVARLALHETELVEQLSTRSVGCAPILSQCFARSWLSVSRSVLSFGKQRIERADLFDEPAVARRRRFRHHDAVVGPLLRAAARQSDFQ